MSKSKSTWATAGFWLPGLVVAVCAAVATAHGLFEVVVASGVLASIAWTYPVITDGLAIVAYVATSRLTGAGRRYAWAVVILAAGLSGLAQAVYFVGGFTAPVPPGPNGEPGSAGNPPPELLRFWVGAWPAIAAAIVAHLLFMLSELRASRKPSTAPDTIASSGVDVAAASGAIVSRAPSVQSQPVQSDRPESVAVQSLSVQSGLVQPKPLDAAASSEPAERPVPAVSSVQPERPVSRGAEEPKPERPAVTPSSPKRDRAFREARKYQALHGTLPTVDQLHEIAEVARGTAGTVLKELREQPHPLHIVTDLNATKANS
ncbi:hypothetical protein [Amycolatopsis regifaucium]|uniref:DUF2637 domain-containing protein n=1 Tax=Amycolatopsis regifaucium TaxID=546365 RepID=A0A154M858_9PSEU|nr:hypothetical protein [Amycolatopsis regifaucium]KZB80834.1 hypothetical protein AVL48_37880 [Amycolatopsis regifaucium]OKA06458.1 hypothetical protein ATP06_0225435 [Amycolatopsis regifaucium]SFJ75242.1 hypothetical protein SAMN04489731_1402 [Amycolatopsis regifaucium]